MKIILKYILTNVKERKTRSAVMLFSILLSTTLLFVSFSIGTSYERAQQKMARGMAGSAAVAVTPADGEISIDMIADSPFIRASVGILEGTALYHENGYYETIDLVGADLTQLGEINPPRLTDGAELSDFSGNQVVLPDRFTSKYGIQKGDIITLQLKEKSTPLKVAAIAAYDTVFLRHTRGATALLPYSTLTELLGKADGNIKILIEPAEGISTGTLKDELSTILPPGCQVSEVVNEAQITSDARQKSMPFFLISFFSLTMSIFIIYSSYKVITLDHLPVIGTFRSIGATQKAVTHLLLLESMLYGCAGGLAGIPLGILVLKLILQGMGQSLSQGIEIPVVISPFSILVSFAAAIIISLLSAGLPVRRASRLPIKDVVLGSVEEQQGSRRFMLVSGIVLFVLSILLPGTASGKMLYVAGGFSLLSLIAAAILLIPFVTDLLSAGLEHIYGIILGNEGKLAARNMRGNKNTSQNITLLFISISAVIVITTVGSFVSTYVSDVFNGAELDGFADGIIEPELVEQVNEMNGIEKVLPVYVYNNQMQADGIMLSRLEATDNLDLYSSMLALHYSQKEMKEQAISSFSAGRVILLSETCMERTGFSTGDTVLLSASAGQNDYLVVGSFKSRATDVEAVIPSFCAVADFKASVYHFLAYTAADPDAIMVQIRALFGDTPNWSRTVEEFNTDALSTVGAFLQPMNTMTYFILLLAIVGIMNNLLIHYMQKRRSIAMYKSVGLSNRQHLKITLIEGFSSGLIGASIAIIVSFLEIQIIFLVAGPKISMSPELNITTFFAAGILGIMISLLGSILPVYKSRKMNLVREIKFE